MKTYYCLTKDSKRQIIAAKNKKEAESLTGIAAELWVSMTDPLIVAQATDKLKIELQGYSGKFEEKA